MKDRIRKLLINGLSAAEISKIVGCSPSYVSQLCKDPEFVREVEVGKLEAQATLQEEEHITVRYQTLEHKLISSIEDSLAEASLGEKVRALEAINKRGDAHYARKNPATQQNPGAVGVTIVNLQLPAHAVKALGPAVELNSQGEVIAINNKPLAPMGSTAVKSLFASIAAQKEEAAQIAMEI